MEAKHNSLLIVLAFAIFKFSACQLEDPKIDLNVDDVLQLVLDTTSLPADGQSTFVITATLLEHSDPNKTLVFSSTYGKFVNGSTANTSKTTLKCNGRTTQALLQVSNQVADRVFVTVDLESFTQQIELSTKPSLPDTLYLSPDSWVLKKNGGSVVTVTIQASKSIGQVSEMLPLFFSSPNTAAQNLLLNFNNLGQLKNGSATVQIKSNSDSTGMFLFRVDLPVGNAAPPISSTIMLEVK